MIEVNNLHYSYRSDKTITFPDFSVKRNESLLLIGESGSGKTTLLHLLGGLLRTQHGSIRINGTDLGSLSETELDHFRGKNIGFIFQKNHLINALSVRKNLLMAPFLAGIKEEDGRIDHVLAELGLLGSVNSKVTELSQGQAQRVAIARAVINKPQLILADEPTSALDDTNCDKVIRLLLELSRENNSTLIIATHDQRLRDTIENQILL